MCNNSRLSASSTGVDTPHYLSTFSITILLGENI